MRITKVHEGSKIHEGLDSSPRSSRASWIFVSSWIFVFVSSWIFVFVSSWTFVFAQTPLPAGAVSIVNEDRFGSLLAVCAETGEPAIQQGAKTIRGTGVWVGRAKALRRLQAGLGACDPAWSPDGRRLAVTAAEGLWVFPATSFEGDLRVESRLPLGGQSEYYYRAFSQPKWSPDGILVAVVVSNGGTSWVEIFEATSGKLFYTSPPGNYSFNWTGARELRLGKTEIQLPAR